VSIATRLVLDESGANLAMTRLYGRAASNQRLHWPSPYARGSHYSIIAAISPHKIVASWYCDGPIEGHFFSEFIKHCLVPVLTSRHCLVMDNVAFHKVKEAVTQVEKTGARILFLPPYSPDLSPIELMWSKIKSVLRKYSAKTAEDFQSAISAAFHSICPLDLKHYFKHCGFKP